MLDEAGIEALYRDLEKSLFNIALRWTWNDAEAHELVQDAFLKLWSARWRIRAETSRAYVYKTVLNLAQKHARKRQTWWRVRQLIPVADYDTSPERSYDDARVQAAIRRLPEAQRSVLLLCEFSDLKQREIARILGIPPGTVASRRNHALKRLRETFHAQTD